MDTWTALRGVMAGCRCSTVTCRLGCSGSSVSCDHEITTTLSTLFCLTLNGGANLSLVLQNCAAMMNSTLVQKLVGLYNFPCDRRRSYHIRRSPVLNAPTTAS